MAAKGFFARFFGFDNSEGAGFVPSAVDAAPFDVSKIKYDFAMSPSARWRHAVPLINDSAEEVTIRGLQFTSNADITNPGSFLEPYWKNVHKTKDEVINLYNYYLLFDPPLKLPKGKTNLLEYDVGNTLGPLNGIAVAPKKIAISLDGRNYQDLSWVPAIPGPRLKTELVVYLANWSQYRPRKRTAAEMLWNDVTGTTYAFIGFDESGKVFALDTWGEQLEVPEIYKQKMKRVEARKKDPSLPKLEVTLGFGGWTNAGKRMDTVFSAMAANPDTRKKFVQGAVAAVLQFDFDGIDIDWEYPLENDAKNYIALLTELRQELTKKIGPQALLSIAAPAGYDKIKALDAEQWQTVAGKVNRIRKMDYDLYGVWDQYADFHAAWELDDASPHKKKADDLYEYSIAKSLALYEKLGVPKEKISIGMPNYARAVIVQEPGARAGLYQRVVGAPPGELNEAGFYTWDAIANVLNKRPSALDSLGVKDWLFYDSDHPYCKKAGSCLLSGRLPNGQWVVLTFLDPKAAQQRAELLKAQGYDATMVWANYCEAEKPEEAVIHAIADGLRKAEEKELQQQATNTRKETSEEKSVAKGTDDLSKKRASFEQTSILSRLADHARKLLGFFGSKKKAEILGSMQKIEDSVLLGRQLLDPEIGGKLEVHRNIFKRVLSKFFPNLFAKPTSFRLAEEHQQNRQVFEKEVPTLVIPGKGTDSYCRMANINPPPVNPAWQEQQIKMPVHHESILREITKGKGQSVPSAAAARLDLQKQPEQPGNNCPSPQL